MKPGKPHAAQKAVPEVDVVVTKVPILARWLTLFALLLSSVTGAAVLPEDRADALYHAYDGGGVTVQGPSVLVRKGFKDTVSVYANYYQDFVSSASIDVISYGSPYKEERTEYSLGGEYLVDSTLLSLGFSNSTENDFVGDTVSFGISQDFFGDMTTLSLGYSEGDDIITRNSGTLGDGETAFEKEAKRRRYSLGLTQILTKSWIIAFSAESAVDDGYLQNPYRQVRYLKTTSLNGVTTTTANWQSEAYPETRNSDAFAVRTMYYLPYRAALKFEARTFTDSWGIEAQNFEVRYIHPLRSSVIMEFKARTYSQTQADFFSDLFDHNARDFMARDKELSTYSTFNFGFGLTYEMKYKLPFAKNQKVSLFWDYLQFDYENFRDQCKSRVDQCGETPDASAAEYKQGEEPSYAFGANVLRLFLTVNY